MAFFFKLEVLDRKVLFYRVTLTTVTIILCTYQLFSPGSGGQTDPRGIEKCEFTLSNSPPKGEKL